VIKVFEIISEDELARRLPRPAAPGTSLPASEAPATPR
jgi:hypothetical protein